jgi:glycosyltransferase involved in cell wall biosynthesis
MNSVAGLVSVVIPFYNAERFLAEAIESVLAQTYTDWELILVDDGSTDGSTEIARRYVSCSPGRIQYLEHPGHLNLERCRSRNLGITRSRGEYIATLDSDDVWLPMKLEQQVRLMEAHPAAGLLYGRSEYWYSWAETAPPAQQNHIPALAPGGKLYYPLDLMKLCYPLGRVGAPCPSDFLLRRWAVTKVGAFEESFDSLPHNIYEDQAFLAKIYVHVPVFVSETCWDRYRVHEMSSTALVGRNGNSEILRRRYFDWLRRYLTVEGEQDAALWRAIRKQSWYYRLPLPESIVRLVRRIANRLSH